MPSSTPSKSSLVVSVSVSVSCVCVLCLCSLFDHSLCLSLYEEMLESPEAIVINVREHIKRKWKPRPLATVELQTLASRKLRMSSEQTMKVAEDLYNNGIIRCV